MYSSSIPAGRPRPCRGARGSAGAVRCRSGRRRSDRAAGWRSRCPGGEGGSSPGMWLQRSAWRCDQPRPFEVSSSRPVTYLSTECPSIDPTSPTELCPADFERFHQGSTSCASVHGGFMPLARRKGAQSGNTNPHVPIKPGASFVGTLRSCSRSGQPENGYGPRSRHRSLPARLPRYLLDPDDRRGRQGDRRPRQPEHPFTKGRLCVKVNDYQNRVYSDQRVLTPSGASGRRAAASSRGSPGTRRSGRSPAAGRRSSPRAGRRRSCPTAISARRASSTPERRRPAVQQARRDRLRAHLLRFGLLHRLHDDDRAHARRPESFVHSKYIIVLWACNTLSTNSHHCRSSSRPSVTAPSS